MNDNKWYSDLSIWCRFWLRTRRLFNKYKISRILKRIDKGKDKERKKYEPEDLTEV